MIQNHQFPIEIHLKYIQDSFNGITIPIAAIGHAWPLKISEHQITSFSSVSLHFESIWMHINMFGSQNHQDPTISLEAGLCTCPLKYVSPIIVISLWHHLGFDGKHVDCIPEREEML